MKKIFLCAVVLGLALSSCLPAAATQPAPAPLSDAELEGTAAVLSQQTLQALQPAETPTLPPTETPVVMSATATNTEVAGTATETQNPILLTLTATLGTGTVEAATGTPGTQTAAAAVNTTGTLPFTVTPSLTPNALTPTTTLHPQHYGTMPPNLPFGKIALINKAKAEVYISLQCTTKEGYVTVIEYPVGGTVETKAPAGRYVYVAWVGGNKLTGSFKLGQQQDLTIKIYKDRIDIK